MKYLKKFNTHAEYELATLDLPNVSLCVQENEVHYNPKETKLVCKYYVEDTSVPIILCFNEAAYRAPSMDLDVFSEMEIDGVVQSQVVSSYQFDTEGEHIVKYTLSDPTYFGAIFYGVEDLKEVIIPDTVTTLEYESFGNCYNLPKIKLSNSITEIDSEAFKACYALNSITLPETLTELGDMVFWGARVISITSLNKTAPSIVNKYADIDGTFYGMPINGTLYIPADSTGYEHWLEELPEGWTIVRQ